MMNNFSNIEDFYHQFKTDREMNGIIESLMQNSKEASSPVIENGIIISSSKPEFSPTSVYDEAEVENKLTQLLKGLTEYTNRLPNGEFDTYRSIEDRKVVPFIQNGMIVDAYEKD